MSALQRIAIAALALASILTIACTSEVIREVSVVSESIREVTVIVEKPVEVPVPQTVIVQEPAVVTSNVVIETVVVEKEVTVVVPVEREVTIQVPVEVVHEVTVEVPVVVEREVTVEVPVEVVYEVRVEVPVPETVIVERHVPVTNTPAPIATAQSTATAANTDLQPSPIDVDDNSRDVAIGLRVVRAVNGLPTLGRSPSTPTRDGGVEEYFFHYENGDAMTPELVEAWDIDPAGTRVRMTMRKGPDGTGIPFNSPVGYEDIDFGVADADNVVRYFNESNKTTNPDTRYLNSNYLADTFLEATKIDDWTVEIGLESPNFFCLPISQFGCLRTDRGLYNLAHADTMGTEWADEHHIGTGPFVQDSCIAALKCITKAIDNHWRATPNIATFTQRQVPDENVRITMLRNSETDIIEVDFSLVSDLEDAGYRFLQTMPGAYIGQSILFPGNLWEHTHPIDGKPLLPWLCDREYPNTNDYNRCAPTLDDGPYLEDYPWIGNPWGTQDAPCSDGDAPGRERCGNAPYADTDNPDGIDDMEQARLVRYALSMAIDRFEINDRFLDGVGTPIYSEYMGPEYPGWELNHDTGCWDWIGNRYDCPDTAPRLLTGGIYWQSINGDMFLAGFTLDYAGYPLVDGKRQGFGKIALQSYVSEAGRVSLDVADYITGQWEKLGIEIEKVVEDYGGEIAPRLSRRGQFLPILKNGIVFSNIFPLDHPFPSTDTSITRTNRGWGVGFESQPASRWLQEITAEPDKAKREKLHLDWVDYSVFWMQYIGVFQIPKGVIAGPRIESWIGRQEHDRNISSNPEFIVLR